MQVIISGKSSIEALTKDGFLSYARVVGYSSECLEQHAGRKQRVIGDGNNWLDQRV